jgi:sulfatase modifying factor 1
MSNPDQHSNEALFPEMIFVKGDTFSMGSNRYPDEQPVHKVKVDDFFLAKFPVTNKEYLAFLKDYGSDIVLDGPYEGQKMIGPHKWGLQPREGVWGVEEGFENHPVILVPWYGAVAYCSWLEQQTGEPYRLPSEAEWEYAAKGGIHHADFKFSGGAKLSEVGWVEENSHGETKPVGLKLPNDLGLYDMSGNVWEWCEDVWHENYCEAPDNGKPWLDGGDPTRRVERGGAWYYDGSDCRVSDRTKYVVDLMSFIIGFRVARY